MLLPLFPRLMLPGTSRCPSSCFMGTIPCPFGDITQAFTLQRQRQPWYYCNHQTVLDHGIMTLTSLFPQGVTIRHLRETKIIKSTSSGVTEIQRWLLLLVVLLLPPLFFHYNYYSGSPWTMLVLLSKMSWGITTLSLKVDSEFWF